MNPQQKHKLRKFIKELEGFRGRHTELVSVYIPADYDLNKIITHLEQEQGTATNIKDARTRKNVIDSLEKAIRHLRLYKKNPDHGLAIFAGNTSDNESKTDINVWSIEPPVPFKTRLYRCDQTFVLDLLRAMLDTDVVYGLIVLDNREATVGLLKGTLIEVLVHKTSAVPGKIKAGGQCHVFGTLIQCSTGAIPKIENSHNPMIVKTMIMGNYSIKESPLTHKWTVQKQEVYKIKTKYPQLIVESSKEHVFFVMTSEGIVEKPAEELRIGDTLLMPEKIEINGKRQKLNPRKYYNSFVISKEGQELLKSKRVEKKLLQRELAKRINVTQTSISFYEIGKLHINKEPLQKLCIECDLNFEEFLERYCQHFHHQGTRVRLPEELTEEFAQFLGYYIGDGCMEIDRITFFEQRKEVALAYKKLFDNFFKIDSSYKFRKSKNYHQLKFTSRPLVRMIRGEFPEIKKTLDTEIPKKVLESENRIVAKFLRGYFDAEGYVMDGSIGIGSNNKTIIGQTLLLLLRFSIIASYLESDNRNNPYSKNPIFKLQINEKESLIKFKDLIGFTSTEKTNKLVTLLDDKTDKSSVRQILASGKKVREIIERSGYNIQLFPKVNNFFRNERMMSKQTFKASILAYVKDQTLYKQLEEIYNSQILPVKIASIEKRKEEVEMVDIAVKNQNFIANGILVHNSAPRFARLREGAIHDFYKRVAEAANEEFFPKKDMKGILVGGPGPTKYDFVDGNYLHTELKQKVMGIKDLTYTGESGLHDLVDKSRDLLLQEHITHEKEVMEKFLETLGKDTEKAAYGKAQVDKALEYGAVHILLLSDSLSDEEIESYEEKALAIDAVVEVISTETREGVQLRDLGKIGALLRFAVH